MRFLIFLGFLLLGFFVQAQADQIETDDGTVTMTPILHATAVLEWGDVTIYMDPYGGADRFEGFKPPDIICITHVHGDHLNKETLSGLDVSNARLYAPQSVINELGPIPFKEIRLLNNGQENTYQGVTVRAEPMYNLPNDDTARHPKGWGNAYVLTIGNKRFYFSGDTEDIPEMRELTDIDYAFVCMNLPYTMTVEQAADAVIEFKPKAVYPFHFRGQDGFSDVNLFKKLVNEGDSDIEVRLRDWYPEK